MTGTKSCDYPAIVCSRHRFVKGRVAKQLNLRVSGSPMTYVLSYPSQNEILQLFFL